MKLVAVCVVLITNHPQARLFEELSSVASWPGLPSQTRCRTPRLRIRKPCWQQGMMGKFQMTDRLSREWSGHYFCWNRLWDWGFRGRLQEQGFSYIFNRCQSHRNTFYDIHCHLSVVDVVPSKLWRSPRHIDNLRLWVSGWSSSPSTCIGQKSYWLNLEGGDVCWGLVRWCLPRLVEIILLRSYIEKDTWLSSLIIREAVIYVLAEFVR